jgi:hypothetical protein
MTQVQDHPGKSRLDPWLGRLRASAGPAEVLPALRDRLARAARNAMYRH